MTIDSLFPEGHVHWFYRFFKCFGKKIKLEGVEDKYHTVICNRFVYTTDGKFFYGYYTPGSAEDLDPFSMMPPDFIFCCQCCCYMCCKCYREKYDNEYEKEADLFFGVDKNDSSAIQTIEDTIPIHEQKKLVQSTFKCIATNLECLECEDVSEFIEISLAESQLTETS